MEERKGCPSKRRAHPRKTVLRASPISVDCAFRSVGECVFDGGKEGEEKADLRG